MARTAALAAILPTMAGTLAFAGAEGGGGADVFVVGAVASTMAHLMVRTEIFAGTKVGRTTAFASASAATGGSGRVGHGGGERVVCHWFGWFVYVA